MSSPLAGPAERVALLSAVAEVVVELSIAARTLQIYGRSHPMAARVSDRVAARIERALEHTEPVAVQFSPDAVFCGPHCLEHAHPIYRQIAGKMWSLGVAGLSFRRGVAPGEITAVLEALNRAHAERAAPTAVAALMAEVPAPHVEVEMIRSFVVYERLDDAAPAPPGDEGELWEELVRRLATLRAGGGAPPPPKEPEGEPETEVPPELAGDYAEAVIEYMRRLERSRERDRTLQSTDLGRRIASLVQEAGPALRQQIMATAVTTPDVSPELLAGLVRLSGREELVDALRRVSARGGALPASAHRTLSLLARLSDGAPADEPVGSEGWSRQGDELRRVLDGLMADDQAHAYVSPGYGAAIDAIQAEAERRAGARAPAGSSPEGLSARESEKHFLLVCEALLAAGPEDPATAAGIARGCQGSAVAALAADDPVRCQRAIGIALRAARGCPEPPTSWAWEEGGHLEALIERLQDGDPWRAGEARDLLAAIGSAAVGPLLELLDVESRFVVRKRALEALVSMEASPASELTALVESDRAWFLRRNALWVLRHRREAAAAAAARAAWPAAPRTLRLEILAYLFAIGDGEATRLLGEAMANGGDEALAAARAVLRDPSDAAVAAVIEAVDALGNYQLGSAFHVGLVRALAACRDAAAQRWVAERSHLRQPRLPWRRRRFLAALAELRSTTADRRRAPAGGRETFS